jgi:glycosyltransferase involved in cell wall biosynthesis
MLARSMPVGAQAGSSVRVLMGVPAAGASGGGPALHVPMLVEDLERAGRVRVVPVAYGRWNEGEPAWIKVAHQALDLLRFPWRVWRARVDVVQLNTSLDRRALVRDTAFAACARMVRKPVFLKWHGSETHLLEPGSAPVWRFLARRLLRNVDTLGVLSALERQQAVTFSPGTRCEIVYNPIDVRRYQRHENLRSTHGLPPDSVVALFISRLIPGKGLLDTVRAVQMLGDERLHLLVVGDGPRRQAAQGLAQELGVGSRVHFVGRVTEQQAAAYYAGSDILVFPSTLTEGFPMSLFQSVAAGMGIVTTRLRAALDHLEDPTHCLYVEPRDPAAVAQALRRLLDEPARLDAMRRANRVLAARFDRGAVANEYERIYIDIARRHGQRRRQQNQERHEPERQKRERP